VAAWERELVGFHRDQEAAGQRHLLLVQPEVTARDPGRLTDPVERAVYNYTLHTRGGEGDPFMAALHRRAQALHDHIPEVVSMAAVTAWPGWVFVDYCHFTADANRRIAEEIGRHILSDGAYRPFPPVAEPGRDP
jgi:hypothetical protein